MQNSPQNTQRQNIVLPDVRGKPRTLSALKMFGRRTIQKKGTLK